MSYPAEWIGFQMQQKNIEDHGIGASLDASHTVYVLSSSVAVSRFVIICLVRRDLLDF